MNRTRLSLGRKPALLLLIVGSVTGGVFARWCMYSGVGVSPDSVLYLSAAESLNAGHGLKPIAFHFSPKVPGGQPQVSVPPTYPLLLSLSGRLSHDGLNAAKHLHTLLFALNILLLGIAVYLSSEGSFLATLCSLLLFCSSPAILEIHTMAWSEPPFILFMLSAFILLTLYMAKAKAQLLVASALMAGLAMTTRYAGITILPPMVLTVLLLKKGELRGRLKDCLVLLGIGCLPLAILFFRNWMVTNSAANRTFAFHPLKISDLRIWANSLLTLWLPLNGNSYVKITLFVLGGALFVACIMLALKASVQGKTDSGPNSVAQTFAAIFVVSYLSFLYLYNSSMNPPVDIEPRVVSPVFVFGIILGISVSFKLGRIENRAKLWWGSLVLGFALVSINTVPTVSFAAQRHVDGSGYTSREWQGSKSIEQLKTQWPNHTIYSNGVDVIHFLTGRKALRIPAKFDPTGGKTNEGFEQEINAMRDQLTQNRAVVVYLDKVTWRWYLPSRDELENVHKLPILLQLDDGIVYGAR